MTNIIHDSTGKAYTIPEKWSERTRCSYTNGKTHIVSISLLAGDAAADYSGSTPKACKDLAAAGGTCPGTCPGCYAMKITRNIAPMIKYALNTIEAKEDPARFVAMVEKELFSGDPLTWPRVVRVHDSGEFFSLAYFQEIAGMVARHPGTVFGAYTKAEEIVNAYGLENIPANWSLSCSPWEGHCNPIGDLPQFIYDDGSNPELASLPHCPAVDKDGKRTGATCDKCLHCYRAKRGDRWAVYAH